MKEHYELAFNKNTNDSQEEILRTSDSLDDLYDYLEDLLSAADDDDDVNDDDDAHMNYSFDHQKNH